MPPEARDSDLQALGARFGNVLSVRALLSSLIRADDSTGAPIEETCCKGVGFILFRDAAEAERAVVGLNCEGFEASYAKVSKPTGACASRERLTVSHIPQESLSLKLRRLGDEASTNLYLTNVSRRRFRRSAR